MRFSLAPLGLVGSPRSNGRDPEFSSGGYGFGSRGRLHLYTRAMQLLIVLAVWIIPTVIAVAILYWVIRLAVRHGIRDARNDERLQASAATSRESYVDADGL